MKALSTLLLAGAMAIPALVQDAKTNAAPESTTNPMTRAVVTLAASAGTITPPLVFTNGAVSQPESTELPAGGKATYNFSIARDGDYLIQALVNAPDEASNSFYVNIDANPVDPTMIWDIEVTSGFQERTVNWRGKGDVDNDEFVPKRFHLTAGEHKLIIIGREPTELKSLSIRPAAK